jgi:hypothetical protein
MAVADALFALSTVPYVVNYLAGWRVTTQTMDFNYDGWTVALLSLPLFYFLI